jgi:hypothetical protein
VIRAEQDLPRTEAGRERESEEGGKGEKWSKQRMHMWINE